MAQGGDLTPANAFFSPESMIASAHGYAPIPKPSAKRPNMAERAQQQQQQQQDLHFPGWSPLRLRNRKVHHGYATIARTLPLAM